MNLFSCVLKVIHRLDSNYLWKIYSYHSKKVLSHSQLVLSFDCDTQEDANVALEVHKKLMDTGVIPVYAVPGELLQKGEKVYRKIHETGAEFINHGGREHTYFNSKTQRHASCFFYDQQTNEDLYNDILAGHQILQDVLGIKANGWRTPHFGTFQKQKHLEFLYSVLKQLNYKFSTSTVPEKTYIKGPIYKNDDILEVPVTGIYSEPFNIMDTWAYFEAPDRTKFSSEYIENAHNFAEFSKDYPVLINIYGDPSHVHDKPEFFQAIKILAQAAQNVNYAKLIENTHENLRNI